MKPLLRFCASVVPKGIPVFTPVRVAPSADKEECYENVRIHVEKHGGEAQHGWAIWEWPQVYWEAEFHCVWRSPDGELVDITPNDPPYPWLLFLPDPVRIYRERLVNNVRKPLIRDALLAKFHEAGESWHRLKRARFLPGFVETPEVLAETLRMIRYRDSLSLQMLNKFGATMTPEMKRLLTSPMPKNQ